MITPIVKFPGITPGTACEFDAASRLELTPILTEENEAAHSALLYAYGTVGQDRISVLPRNAAFAYNQPYLLKIPNTLDNLSGPQKYRLQVPACLDSPQEGFQADALIVACQVFEEEIQAQTRQMRLLWIKSPGYREALAARKDATNKLMSFVDFEEIHEIRIREETGEVRKFEAFDAPNGLLHPSMANAWMKWIAVYGTTIEAGVVLADMAAPDTVRLRAKGIDPRAPLYSATTVEAAYKGRPKTADVRVPISVVERAFTPSKLVQVGATGYDTHSRPIPFTALQTVWRPQTEDESWNARYVHVLISALWFDPEALPDQRVVGVVERWNLPKGV